MNNLRTFLWKILLKSTLSVWWVIFLPVVPSSLLESIISFSSFKMSNVSQFCRNFNSVSINSRWFIELLQAGLMFFLKLMSVAWVVGLAIGNYWKMSHWNVDLNFFSLIWVSWRTKERFRNFSQNTFVNEKNKKTKIFILKLTSKLNFYEMKK